jgi:hypothetical protein
MKTKDSAALHTPHPLTFGIDQHLFCNVGIGKLININMTVSRKMFDDQHRGFGDNTADETNAARSL